MHRRDFLVLVLGVPGFALAAPTDAGDSLWSQGDIDGAIAAWERLLASTPKGAERAAIYLRIAAAQREAGRLRAAEGSLDAAETMGGVTGALLNERGLLALAGGDAPGAVATLSQAFRAAKADGAAASLGLAASIANNMGLARTALGDHGEAMMAFQAARSVFLSLGDKGGQADALANIGLAHRRQGQLREARGALDSALLLVDPLRDIARAIDIHNDLALVLLDLGADDEAARELGVAMTTATGARRAALLANLAQVSVRGGQLEEASRGYREAEAEYRRAGRDDEALAVSMQRALVEAPDATAYRSVYERAKSPSTRATAALNLAGLLLDSDRREVLRLAAEARALSATRDVGWRADYLEGRVALAEGRRDAAITLLRRAIDQLERTRAGLREAEARGFRTRHEGVYAALLDATLLGGDTRGAAAVAERLALSSLDAPPVPEAEASAVRAAEERLAWLDRELEGATDERAAALRLQMGRAEADFAAKVDEMRLSTPHFAELVRTDPEDLEAVRRELPEGVVVLQPVALADRLVLLVYRRERLVAREVPIAANALNTQVMRVSRSLRAADTWDPAWTASECEKLGVLLWQPIAQEIATAKTVVISATGALRFLPFALLRYGGKWLVEVVPVASVTHVGSLRVGAGRFAMQGPAALLVGNPDGSLPGAEDEVITIQKLLPGATTLVRDQGTRGAVLGACGGKGLVHLATHGVLDPDVPDRSHIVLTGYPDLAGRLGYQEIPALGPWIDQARLVVLSACESGLPVDKPGGEGVPRVGINGLAAQFRRAGVETLIASLWSVSDAGTMALMSELYRRLAAGDDIARAMQNAQLSMLRDPGLAHPYFWAPFVVFGDWR